MLDMIVYGNVTLFDIITVIIILMVGMIISKIITLNMRRSLKDNIDAPKLRIITKIVNFAIIIVTLIIAVPMLGVSWEGLLIAGGIIGLVLAFATQSIISNLFAGIFLMFERPMKIGDNVNIEDNEGTVEDIKILSTIIRGYDGYIYRLPNEKVFTNRITNFSNTPARRFEFTIGIRYDDDADKAINIINELVEENPYMLKNPKHQAYVDNLGDNSVNIIVRVWAPVPVWYDEKMKFVWKVKSELEQNGIEIPFPQRTIWFGDGETPNVKPKMVPDLVSNKQ